jgi:hypothetical protein
MAVRDLRGRIPQLVSLDFQLVPSRPPVNHLARDPRSLGEHRNKHLSIRKTGEAALPRQGSRALAARLSLRLFTSSPIHLPTSPPLHLSTSPPLDLSTYSPPHLVAGEAKLSRFDAMLDYEQYVLLDWLPIRVQKFV